MRSEPLLSVSMVAVAAPGHPLASLRKSISERDLAPHVQLVLTDRTPLTEGKTFGVLASSTWKLADLGAKHAFLKAGFGWGMMPQHMVQDDLDSGALVRLPIKQLANVNMAMPMHAIFLKDAPPGPAGRWFLEQLAHPISIST